MATVGVEGLSVVHVGSGGTIVGTPDTCYFNYGGTEVPTTFVVTSQSSNLASGSKQTKCEGNVVCLLDSNWSSCNGDEASSQGGVCSGTRSGKTEFTSGSLTVRFEGKAVVRALDLASYNSKNGATTSVLQGPLVVPPSVAIPKCLICGKPLA